MNYFDDIRDPYRGMANDWERGRVTRREDGSDWDEENPGVQHSETDE